MVMMKKLAAVGVCLLACAAVLAEAGPPASTQEVSGVYTVSKSAIEGTNEQVTLRIELTSSADATLTSQSVGLRSLLTGETQNTGASFSLPAHGNADFSVTVTISQAEYKLWQNGARPLLVLTLSSGGQQITQTVALVPSGAAGAN
jgi:hypothetical protein